ncbi:peptidoglycan endopeptidase [Naumannella sp. ID2617S]|nr:peptidoglycan endopeptidase [Naumannella sp. ID2617S]
MVARMHKALRAGVLAATVGAMVATGAPQVALADPDAVAKAKATVESLSMEAAALDQEALGAQEQLDSASKRLKNREADMTAQTTKVDRMRSQVGQVALAQFQNRSLSPTTQVVLRSDSDSFLSEYSTIQQVSNNQNSTLQEFQTQQANLADMKRGAAADVDTIDKSTKALKRAREDSEKKVAEAQKVLNRLTAEERARLAEEQAREAREAQERAEQAAQQASNNDTSTAGRRSTASATPSARPSTSATPKASASATPQSTRSPNASAPQADPAPVANASGRGGAAIGFARAQLGKPYIYGGTGPSGYDCSGLTMAAYKAAGVSIPRTSQAQYAGAGSQIPISSVQPGDLVFYGDLSHVAIYVGGGQVIHAPNSTTVVKYAPLTGRYTKAVRVG